MDIVSIVISLFVLLFAITIHEAAHAWSAHKFGDPTAWSLGRASLNPIVHIDPLGTVLFPIILAVVGAPVFGWAKPVPVNPYNLRNPRRDNLWISFSGPAANLTAAAAGLILILILKGLFPGLTEFLYSFLTRQGYPQGFFPLQGLMLILYFGVLINTYLAIFNLIPIPPLDGSGILSGLLSDEAAEKYDRIRPYGFFIVLILIYLGFLGMIIRPIHLFILTVIFF